MTTRRTFLAGAAAITLLPLSSADATPEALQAAIKEIVGTARLKIGRASCRERVCNDV